MKSTLCRAIVLALAAAGGGPLAASPASPAPVPMAVPATTAPSEQDTSVAPELPAPAETIQAMLQPEQAAPAPEPAVAPIPTLAMSSGEEVFAHLRQNLKPNNCDAGSNSARWRERYAGSPTAFSRRLQSVLPLLDFVSTEVERAGLPAEFTFIPLVESWYQPAALGPGGPAGMWQMIGSTARNHGIHIREGYDGRLSPVESTRAALSYLKVLQDMFGDWQAIVMAYNAGEGRMQHAMRRAGSRVTSAADRRPHGLSNITYDYVAKLQALSCLVSQPQRFGLHLPVDARFEPLVPLLIGPGMRSLDEFASANAKDADLLRRLNPGFRNGRVVDGVPRLVLAPPGSNLAETSGTTASTMALVVPLADAPVVAQAPAAEPLAEAEPLASAFMVPTAFDTATVDTATAPQSEAVAPDSAKAVTSTPAALAPTPATHLVRSGESLWSIAHFYHLPIEQLLRANRLDGKASVRPGQMLRLQP